MVMVMKTKKKNEAERKLVGVEEERQLFKIGW